MPKKGFSQRNSMKRTKIAIAVGVTVLIAALSAAAVFFSLNRDEEKAADVGVYISISYPELQADGTLAETNRGMAQVSSDTLRAAMEGGYAGIPDVRFNDDGSIAQIGEVKADEENYFEIHVLSTTDDIYEKGLNVLSPRPDEINLYDGYTYEIYYVSRTDG